MVRGKVVAMKLSWWLKIQLNCLLQCFECKATKLPIYKMVDAIKGNQSE